jgi:hypothetical protein
LAGNKEGLWEQWHKTAIPDAERLFEACVAELRREGLLK